MMTKELASLSMRQIFLTVLALRSMLDIICKFQIGMILDREISNRSYKALFNIFLYLTTKWSKKLKIRNK